MSFYKIFYKYTYIKATRYKISNIHNSAGKRSSASDDT